MIRARKLSLVGACCFWIFLAGCRKHVSTPQAVAPRKELNVAAAADLQFALAAIADQFRQSHPDIDVKITYGSSGNFYAQLVDHAPFDLFLSADTSYPTKLLDGGEAAKGSEFKYAVGRIVLWAGKGSPFDPAKRHLDVLRDPALKRLAIANPDHAPYGRAAQSALKKYDLWDTLQPKLVLGGNISETASMARTGAADVGIIALSLALSPRMTDAGTYFEIPVEDYPTITQEGVILSYAKNPKDAEEFKAVLIGKAARTILEQFGFGIPKE